MLQVLLYWGSRYNFHVQTRVVSWNYVSRSMMVVIIHSVLSFSQWVLLRFSNCRVFLNLSVTNKPLSIYSVYSETSSLDGINMKHITSQNYSLCTLRFTLFSYFHYDLYQFVPVPRSTNYPFTFTMTSFTWPPYDLDETLSSTLRVPPTLLI
jgi:hypothetical protein